ncbi:hypothetical protein DPEC_G00346410 [Dallia pectoralis]|uniref:Uncharacterized protein n=1 Tax=Dallia pectoralis TaxID=75939 RepID=A0ACC2F411_DALPE|nr:hypothetical protein DPEC_G00346410 [Dallia pectoralis]
MLLERKGYPEVSTAHVVIHGHDRAPSSIVRSASGSLHDTGDVLIGQGGKEDTDTCWTSADTTPGTHQSVVSYIIRSLSTSFLKLLITVLDACCVLAGGDRCVLRSLKTRQRHSPPSFFRDQADSIPCRRSSSVDWWKSARLSLETCTKNTGQECGTNGATQAFTAHGPPLIQKPHSSQSPVEVYRTSDCSNVMEMNEFDERGGELRTPGYPHGTAGHTRDRNGAEDQSWRAFADVPLLSARRHLSDPGFGFWCGQTLIVPVFSGAGPESSVASPVGWFSCGPHTATSHTGGGPVRSTKVLLHCPDASSTPQVQTPPLSLTHRLRTSQVSTSPHVRPTLYLGVTPTLTSSLIS